MNLLKGQIPLILSLFLLFSISTNLTAQERIEPPFWWTGMKQQQMQLMVYEQGIGNTRPQINYNGVQLDRVVSVENENYLFIYLTITDLATAGEIKIDFVENGEIKLSTLYPLKDRKEGSAEIKGFDGSDVMYLITPDRFANGNPDNDDIEGMKEQLNRNFEGGRHGGDIAGIRQNLDYLDDMGFTAIWLNPVLENDMYTYSYHGYAATDFYKVDARYGTNEEYLAFIQEAKERGMKVIMDMILNHSGSEHWMVLDPPTADWINFGGKFTGTSHRKHTVQDIHASEFDKKQFVDGWFVETMPDLNQRNLLFSDYLIMNSLWWIEYSGIAGIRMDTYPYPDKDFMTEWTRRIMEEYPNFNIVGEEWNGNPAIVSYWQADKVNHDGYVSYLPSLMDFPVQEALRDAFLSEERSYGSGLILLYEMIAFDFLYPHPQNLVIFPDNHDMDRFYTSMEGDIDKLKMALAFYSVMRGTPQIYYGTEVLMDNKGYPGNHGIIRSDFPGGWSGDSVNGFTGEGLSEQAKDVQSYLKRLLNWRKTAEVVHHGKLMQFVPFDGMYAFFRYNDQGERVMFVMNKNESSKQIDLSRFNEILKENTTAFEVISASTVDLSAGTLQIPAKSAMILEIK